MINVALLQIGATSSKDENINKVKGLFEQLVKSKKAIHFICLPELFSYLPDPDDSYENLGEVAEKIGGPTTKMLTGYAKKIGAYIVTGSFLERRANRHFNTSLVISPEGKILAEYRKIHLFDIREYKESTFFNPGNQISTLDTKYGRIGLTICYDLRFPELFRTLVLKGAELIFCPAAFPIAGQSPGEDHWQILTKAAALQNMIYLVAVNQIGYRRPFYYFGRSTVIDPWGIEIAKAPNKECVFYAEIDMDYLREMRKTRMPLEHRRPEIYEL